MKKAVLTLVGKTLLALCPIVWKFEGKFWINLHQSMAKLAVSLHHRYDLNLIEE
jgi:hypothetical protein